MLSQREPPVKVAAILGQSLAVLLETYAHYIPDDQEGLSLLMDSFTTPIPVNLSRTDRATKIEVMQDELYGVVPRERKRAGYIFVRPFFAKLFEWGRRDLNPHALRHMILSHACLPVPALPRGCDYNKKSQKRP